MICVECGKPIQHVMKIFGDVDNHNIRLTRCRYCRKSADKYVEYEYMLILIDLILHKIQVYRHIIFNRLPYVDVWIPVRPLLSPSLLTPSSAQDVVSRAEKIMEISLRTSRSGYI